MTNTLANVRRAYRYVVAYERRVLDALSQIHASVVPMDLAFKHWGPRGYRFCERKTAPSLDAWSWDNVPFFDARFEWSLGGRSDVNLPGSMWLFVDHVADTAFEERTDTGGEPDPLELPDAGASRSVLRAWWVALEAPLPEKTFEQDWEVLVAQFFGAETSGTLGPGMPPSDAPREVEREGVVLGGHAIALDDIEAPRSFGLRFLHPLLTSLKARAARTAAGAGNAQASTG